ncbi:MAG: LysM peptidoglycan-binding domain-containing protein [Verrucomicrobiota bacterium]
MKRHRMTVKRRPVKKGAVRTLFAKATNRKKRQRAATSAASAGDLESDVPNLGVARALVVILVIHVVAIAGIFFHSHWLDDESTEVAAAVAEKPVVEPIAEPDRSEPDLPKFKSGDSVYTVGAGDTYENIASRFGVTENELRLANDNIAIRAGRYLRIPKKTIVAVEPAEITALREQPEPAAPAPVAPVVEQPAAPSLVETDAARRADATPGSPAAASSSYVVKPGDTFWSIARKHGSSVDALMKANGISDARRLRVGMSLTIPR